MVTTVVAVVAVVLLLLGKSWAMQLGGLGICRCQAVVGPPLVCRTLMFPIPSSQFVGSFSNLAVSRW